MHLGPTASCMGHVFVSKYGPHHWTAPSFFLISWKTVRTVCAVSQYALRLPNGAAVGGTEEGDARVLTKEWGWQRVSEGGEHEGRACGGLENSGKELEGVGEGQVRVGVQRAGGQGQKRVAACEGLLLLSSLLLFLFVTAAAAAAAAVVVVVVAVVVQSSV